MQPIWAGNVSLYALWDESGESPEWIAGRTDALLRALTAAFEIPYWETSKGASWQGSPDALTDIVRSFAVVDSLGELDQTGGYIFTVSGAGPKVGMHVRIAAGDSSPGGRIPLHDLTIQLREVAEGGVDSETGDAICRAVAEAFQPSALALADPAVRRLARRGGWKIGVGYRVWINQLVGAIQGVSAGLHAVNVAGGTLVSAPDDWQADRVVAAMAETLATNGLDVIPR